ncbi:protein mono-ADP-ribosyltransferase PARP14-like [Mya arenaria]|uniref:protein mono-ADP-ribosyltransferase PARP14-like n=1 Tax=Mya arenaria TaxID=6604 RepID=UPI0022E3A450|nr:protein mono-ADP-ribosyltransferase PARP14-like [Mya arenaria]
MKKCGKSLLDEANSKKVDMKKYEVVITKAPHLKCRQIMHVVAKESPQDWKQIIVKCLERAKKKGFRSLAFPALGTGMSASVAAATAQIMVQATKEFAADGCGSLTDVRFVIFQKEMIDSFHGAIRKAKGLQGVGVGLPPPPKPSTRRFSKIEADKDAVLFTLWALNMNTITSAIQKLDSCIEREVSTKVFDDTVISRMNDKQLKAIKQKADENHVEYKLIGGVIQIVGVMQNVVNVTDDIYASLRDAAKIEQDQNAAMILKDIVQWYWIEQTEMEDELKPYEMMLNYQIEQAFKAQKDNFTYTDNGEEVVVDFKNCSEYCKSKPGEKDTIIRKYLIKEFSGEVPANWKAMKGNLLVYKLAPADKEYTDLSGRFHASSGGGYTIHSIEKVQNKSLWLQYEAKKKQLEGQNPAGTKNEQFLWHGTSEDTVDSVNAHGFNRSYCGKNATAFGDGVYFAVNANYSCSDTYSRPGAQGLKKMYYCAVLTGEFILGKSGMRVQPPKTNAGKNALYDSVVNNVAGPAMYIIFNDTQAYPLYIITFKKQ